VRIMLSICSIFLFTACSYFESQPPSLVLQSPIDDDEFTIAQGGRVPAKSQLDSGAIKVLLKVDLIDRIPERSKIEDELKLYDNLPHNLRVELEKQGIEIASDSENPDFVKKLREAIENSEREGRGEFTGQAAVDYFIDVLIGDSSVVKMFKQPAFWSKQGSCEVLSKGVVRIDVAPLPSLSGMKRVVFEDTSSFEFGAEVDKGCADITEMEMDSRLNNAGVEIFNNLLNCSSHALKGFLQPKAYITRHFREPENNRFVYQITAGTRVGFDVGDKVVIEQQVPNEPDAYIKVAEAKVMKSLSGSAYIELADRSMAQRVSKYDRVSLSRSGFLSTVTNRFAAMGCDTRTEF